MEAWKDERNLRIKYEARSSIEAFKLDINRIWRTWKNEYKRYIN